MAGLRDISIKNLEHFAVGAAISGITLVCGENICSRNFRISTTSIKDLMSLTEDATRVRGIHFVMDAYREEAEEILDA